MEVAHARLHGNFEFWLMVECPHCGETVNCMTGEEFENIDTVNDLFACIEIIAMHLTPECPMVFHQCEDCRHNFLIDFTDVMEHVQSPVFQASWTREVDAYLQGTQ